MKKTALILSILALAGLYSCKKGYTLLDYNILCKINLKDPFAAVGRNTATGSLEHYSLLPSSLKVPMDFADGYLYIADNFTNRIIKYNSEGKPVLIIYTDNAYNTQFLGEQNRNIKIKPSANITYSKHDVSAPSSICADKDGNIYVETFKKKEGEANPFHYILKFDKDGKFLFKIGRDGRDGLHFGDNEIITSLFSDSSSNLYITSRYKIDPPVENKKYGIELKAFDSEGKFLYRIKSLKIMEKIETDDNLFTVMENMLPAPSSNAIIFSVSFYKDKEKLKKGERIELERKVLYKIDLTSNKIEKIRTFPENEHSLYALTRSGRVYLNSGEGTNLNIISMTSEGKVLKRNMINFFRGEGKFVVSRVNADGKIIGMFYSDNTLNLYSWF
jgi:hypothetical protein